MIRVRDSSVFEGVEKPKVETGRCLAGQVSGADESLTIDVIHFMEIIRVSEGSELINSLTGIIREDGIYYGFI